MKYGNVWNTEQVEKLLKMGIEVARSDTPLISMTKKQKKNIKRYLDIMLRRNRRHTIRSTCIEFFDQDHVSWRGVQHVLDTLYILGFGYYARGRSLKPRKEFKQRWNGNNCKPIDLDLFLLECMNDALKPEGISLASLEEEKKRIIKDGVALRIEATKEERIRKRIEEAKIRKKKREEEEKNRKKLREKEKARIRRKKETERSVLTSKKLINKATGNAEIHVDQYLKEKSS